MSDAAKLCRERCRRGVGAAMPGARGDASPEMSGRAKKDGAGEFLPPAGGALFDADDERVASGAGDEMLSSDATVRIGGGRPPTAALAAVAAVTTVASAPGALPDRAGPRLDNRELEPKERTRMTLALCWAEPLSTSAYPPSSESPKEPKEAGEAIVIGGGIAKAGARGARRRSPSSSSRCWKQRRGSHHRLQRLPPVPPWSTSHAERADNLEAAMGEGRATVRGRADVDRAPLTHRDRLLEVRGQRPQWRGLLGSSWTVGRRSRPHFLVGFR